ncbi:MAG TPA: LacI family DNA-binding transcriptional regulator [Candidatus Scatomonas pullistercoris]|uniref:LacI family DNA-binding transcriptional regulator n=1 Tax=Candidatus Scatomonas pullistercoris TaxID=2840920 RepID=A0A9D1TBZ0_9FIRM|nr:LacI family DNA-binding transcriptional regulator [Candidatus Scatomonas pullistercoris]
MATIKEVAELANVSVATVSRVLNRSHSVSPKSTAMVMDAIHKLNYSPNLTARNLRRNESRSILVFIPRLSNPYYYSILEGISSTARELDYSAYICNLEHDPQQEAILLHTIQNKRADGIIFLFCNQDDIWLKKYIGTLPMVFCSEYVESLNTPYVGIDHFKAAYEAVQRLIKLGHKKIGMISNQNGFISTTQRYQGFCQALNDHGLLFRRDYIVYASMDYSFDSGVEAAKKLLTLPDPPTAIFCISDLLALGAVSAANELGIPVPERLSIWGFDDLEFAKMFHPHLSTVAQPCFEMGRTAMLHLNQSMAGSDDFEMHTILPYQIIERESTCALQDDKTD